MENDDGLRARQRAVSARVEEQRVMAEELTARADQVRTTAREAVSVFDRATLAGEHAALRPPPPLRASPLRRRR